MHHTRPVVGMMLVAFFVGTAPAYAADPSSFEVRQASVIIQCGDKQGSGVVINSEKGYVLTNAHVLLNEQTSTPDPCEVGFITSDSSYFPGAVYAATSLHSVYDESDNRDYAILQIGRFLKGEKLNSFPALLSNEFAQVNDLLTIIAYPAESSGAQYVSTGKIDTFDQGTIRTQAFIGHGSSGGPGVDAQGHLVGIGRGIIYASDAANEATDQPVGYELVDIRNVLNWLDTLGAGGADAYITHADPVRYQAPLVYTAPTPMAPANLSCKLLAKSVLSPTVYCLKSDGTRAVFPNQATYTSWFSDFSAVVVLSPQDLAAYTLNSTISLKTGSLIKIESDPKVYLVTDSAGTLRWIPTEHTALTLYGQGWAGFVKDVSPSLFSSYHIGDQLPQS